MSVILVLIGASLFVAIGFLLAFIWAVKDGQYDDKYTPSVRMLFDDDLNSENNPARSKHLTGTASAKIPDGGENENTEYNLNSENKIIKVHNT
jgi:cbb3-type cytochrome oxidase maturation protein